MNNKSRTIYRLSVMSIRCLPHQFLLKYEHGNKNRISKALYILKTS